MSVRIVIGGERTADDITTRCYDLSGDPLWTADHGVTVYGVDVDSSGNVVTAGDSAAGDTDRLRKYDLDGQLLWSGPLGWMDTGYFSAFYSDVKFDSEGNIVVAGDGYAPVIPPFSYYTLAKYDLDGGVLWRRSRHRLDNGVATDSSDNIISVGERRLSKTTIKSDPDGNEIWSADHGADVYDVVVDSNGDIITTGSETPTSPIFTTRKYDESGGLIWSARYGGGISNADSFGVDVDAADDVFVVGGIDSEAVGGGIPGGPPPIPVDMNFRKISKDGDSVFFKYFGGTIRSISINKKEDDVFISADSELIKVNPSSGSTIWYRSHGEIVNSVASIVFKVSAIESLLAEPISSEQINVAWTGLGGPYEIQGSRDGGSWTLLATDIQDEFYHHINLTPGQTWRYQVRYIGGDWSGEVEATSIRRVGAFQQSKRNSFINTFSRVYIPNAVDFSTLIAAISEVEAELNQRMGFSLDVYSHSKIQSLLSRDVFLSSGISPISDVNTPILLLKNLSSLISSESNILNTVSVARSFLGSIEPVSNISFDLGKTTSLSLGISAISNIVPKVSTLRNMSSRINIQSEVRSLVNKIIGLSLQTGSVSNIDSILSAILSFSTISDVVSNLFANLEVDEAGLSAAINVVSDMVATLGVVKSLSGSIGSHSGTYANPTVIKSFGTNIYSNSSLISSLSRLTGYSSSVEAKANIVASILRKRGISASVYANSSLDLNLGKSAGLSSNVNSESIIDLELSKLARFSTQINEESFIQVFPSVIRNLRGSINPKSNLKSDIKVKIGFTSNIHGKSEIFMDLFIGELVIIRYVVDMGDTASSSRIVFSGRDDRLSYSDDGVPKIIFKGRDFGDTKFDFGV